MLLEQWISHIAIKAPHVNHEDYFNRKQNYSINLQGVVDATGKFIDVSTGWPVVFTMPEY